jgi:hypothetical protein
MRTKKKGKEAMLTHQDEDDVEENDGDKAAGIADVLEVAFFAPIAFATDFFISSSMDGIGIHHHSHKEESSTETAHSTQNGLHLGIANLPEIEDRTHS